MLAKHNQVMIGSRFRYLRDHFRKSQAEFAESVGLTHGSISRIESGKIKPKDSVILAICMKYAVNRDWLETGEGDMVVTHSEHAERVEESPPKYPDSSATTGGLLRMVEEIMNSDDEGTKLALTQNIHMFHEKIEEKTQLLKRIDALEKVLHPYVPAGSEAKEE